jgi:hypothetical protein
MPSLARRSDFRRSAKKPTSGVAEPLRKLKDDGSLYTWPPDLEASIDVLLGLPSQRSPASQCATAASLTVDRGGWLCREI